MIRPGKDINSYITHLNKLRSAIEYFEKNKNQSQKNQNVIFYSILAGRPCFQYLEVHTFPKVNFIIFQRLMIQILFCFQSQSLHNYFNSQLKNSLSSVLKADLPVFFYHFSTKNIKYHASKCPERKLTFKSLLFSLPSTDCK